MCFEKFGVILRDGGLHRKTAEDLGCVGQSLLLESLVAQVYTAKFFTPLDEVQAKFRFQ